MFRHRHDLAREGAVTGLIGAAVVALWFFAIDLAAGRPFITPSVLGEVFVFGSASPSLTVVSWWAVLAYTIVHGLAFLVIGVSLTGLFHAAMVSPLARPALLISFIAFELFFLGVTLLFAARTGQLFPAWSVLLANGLSAAAMGGWLWRAHPAVRRAIDRLPLGAGR